MRIGAHQSISGGLFTAAERASNIGIPCFQMFTKAPQTWQEPELLPEQIRSFKQECKRCGFQSTDIAVHAAYLVNTCSENEQTRQKAVRALVADAQRCDALGIGYLIFHPGSPGKQGNEIGIELVADAVRTVLESSRRVHILFENTAGTGKSIGHTFEQLAQLIECSGASTRLGCCFDTAHAFAAGYNLANIKEAADSFNHFNQTVGAHRLKWFHLNDSKTKLGSRIDRHERIGNGRIGGRFFKWLLNASFAEHLPGILETPLEKGETYRTDIERLLAIKR